MKSLSPLSPDRRMQVALDEYPSPFGGAGPSPELPQQVADFVSGAHACLIYEREPADQFPALVPFVAAGLRANERVLYVADDQTPEAFTAGLARQGLAVESALASGQMQVITRAEWRQPGDLDSHKKAEQFRGFVRAAQRDGYAGVRFGVEMTWTLNPAIQVERLEHWEATINTLLAGEFPVRIICQYSRARLSEEVILAALHTHPLVIEGDAVHRNPFYKAPLILGEDAGTTSAPGPADRDFGARPPGGKHADWMLTQLRALTARARQAEAELRLATDDRARLAVQKQHSDELCRAIVESSRDCIKILGMDGVVLSINDAGLALFGHANVIGLSWLDLWQGEDRAAARRALADAAAGGQGRLVGRFPHEGAERWWDVLVTPIRNGAGRPETLLAVSRDVTEQRRVAENLRLNEDRLSMFLEEATIGLHRVGPDGTILWANRAELQMLGYPSSEYIGRPITEFHADAEVVADILARLKRGERLTDFPARLVARDGSIRHVLIDSSGRWEDGKFVHTQCFTRDVTAAARAEAEVRGSEERLRRLLSLMPVAVYTIDTEGRITFYNHQALQLWGRAPAEGENAPRFCNAFGLWLPDGTPLPLMATPIVDAVRSGKSTRNGNVVFGRPDGTRVPVNVNIEPLRDEAGAIVGAINVVQDFTAVREREREIERLNAELHQRLEEFEALLRTAPVGIGVATDPECEHIWHNPASAGLIPGPAKSELGTNADAEAPPSFGIFQAGRPVAGDDLPMQRACRLGIEVTGEEFEIVRADGSVIHELAFASPLFTGDGAVRGCIGVFLDISRQKQVEAALRRSESLLRELADSMPQMVWAARPDGQIDYFNRRWYDYTGQSESQGHDSWSPILHPEELEQTKAAYAEAVRTQTIYQVECRLKNHATGLYRWFLVRALPIRDGEENVIRWFGTCTDIDDQKRSTERLEQAVAERTETLRSTIAELEAFSYSISHDLRGPLRSMQGFAEIIEEDFGRDLGKEGLGYVQRIRTAASRMDRLIQDVLTLNRTARAELELEPVDLDALVRGILDSYPNLQARNASIVIEGRLPRVQGNPAALTQCFSNLLGNAVKFVPAERVPLVRINVQHQTGSNLARISIHDNGVGISADAHDRIFRIFERIDDNYEGTGIGLAIVKTTVTRLRGRVGVESHPGLGSTFWVELLLADNP